MLSLLLLNKLALLGYALLLLLLALYQRYDTGQVQSAKLAGLHLDCRANQLFQSAI